MSMTELEIISAQLASAINALTSLQFQATIQHEDTTAIVAKLLPLYWAINDQIDNTVSQSEIAYNDNCHWSE